MADRNMRVRSGEDIIEHNPKVDRLEETPTYKRRVSLREADNESVFSEKVDGVRESDLKKRQV